MNKINVIIPVYADWSSLKLNIRSMLKYYKNSKIVQVFYVNDCGPEASFLENKIKKLIKNNNNFHYYANKQNLGFLKSCNNAVDNIVDRDGDILLLNSDTKVTLGFVEEMQKVLYSSDEIGIVNPRSNNATIWSVPMNATYANRPNKAYRHWKRLKKTIPEMYISPTSHGFCMLTRRDIIEKIGLFDEVYGKGYAEENDFTMRALKNGWKCAVSNYSFVFHYESRSFGNEARLELSQKNRKILDKRYPEYTGLVNGYLSRIDECVVKKDSILWRFIRRAYKLMEYGHYNGLKKVAYLFYKKAISIFNISDKNSPPSIKVWCHELTNSGAPIVLYSLLKDMLNDSKICENDINMFYSLGCRTESSYLNKVKDLGIEIKEDLPHKRLFVKGDIVILNSSGYGYDLYDNLLNNLENDIIKHLFFYIHEDSPIWTGFDKPNFDDIKIRFKKMIDKGLVTIYTPSEGSRANWMEYFNTKKDIKVMPGRISLNNVEKKTKRDFDDIKFVVSGTVEPRKMQLSVLGAFDCFYDFYYKNNKEKYRNWSVSIIGTYPNEPNNIYNKNTKRYDTKYNNRIKIYDKMPLTEAIEVIKKSNVSILYSSDESFGMVTVEGMAFGHPIIRSEASGWREQLMDETTGWSVNSGNLSTLVHAIEELLNKDKTSLEKLHKMSINANKVALSNIRRKYILIDDLKKFI